MQNIIYIYIYTSTRAKKEVEEKNILIIAMMIKPAKSHLLPQGKISNDAEFQMIWMKTLVDLVRSNDDSFMGIYRDPPNATPLITPYYCKGNPWLILP